MKLNISQSLSTYESLCKTGRLIRDENYVDLARSGKNYQRAVIKGFRQSLK